MTERGVREEHGGSFGKNWRGGLFGKGGRGGLFCRSEDSGGRSESTGSRVHGSGGGGLCWRSAKSERGVGGGGRVGLCWSADSGDGVRWSVDSKGGVGGGGGCCGEEEEGLGQVERRGCELEPDLPIIDTGYEPIRLDLRTRAASCKGGREGETGGERGREREGERQREREREGGREAERESERGREAERERARGGERVFVLWSKEPVS